MEYAVKATYLYKLVPFVEWPPESFSAPDSPLQICIAANDPFGAALDEAVTNIRIGQRPIGIARLKTMSSPLACQLLYINGNASTVKHWLNHVKGQPILTVTELDPGESPIGIINFVMVNSHVRFAVDNVEAKKVGLILSTKLLALATTVTGSAQ